MNWSEYCGGKPLKGFFSFNNVIIFNGRENKFEANQVPKLEKAMYFQPSRITVNSTFLG